MFLSRPMVAATGQRHCAVAATGQRRPRASRPSDLRGQLVGWLVGSIPTYMVSLVSIQTYVLCFEHVRNVHSSTRARGSIQTDLLYGRMGAVPSRPI